MSDTLGLLQVALWDAGKCANRSAASVRTVAQANADTTTVDGERRQDGEQDG
jgi:hypothetical protein